jgi:NAD(P)-dependent dehydrogenase (short-subunit alcohol dehydrogenase family)
MLLFSPIHQIDFFPKSVYLTSSVLNSSLPTTVSRAAGMALTKAMSKDLGPDNIRAVNIDGGMAGVL